MNYMKRALVFLTFVSAALFFASSSAMTAVFADNGQIVIVADDCECLSDSDEREVLLSAQTFADKTGFNVVILITDNVGYDKSDRGVIDYADVYYETLCGINTDGLLLLINNDTEYDYISTSGACINYYSDARIDSMFDWFFDDIKAGRYKQAALHFIDSADYYYRQGRANNQFELAGKEMDPSEILVVGGVLFVFALSISCIIYSANKQKHMMQKPMNNWYVVKGSLLFSQATNTYVGTHTTRIYSPRSSGGGSHGGGGRSSTHHSSGGGRHGGGGRHR